MLNRTFVHEQDAPASDEIVRRLKKSQEEIAAATGRFASGIAQRSEPIPGVKEALAAMNMAIAALAGKKLAVARPFEETALSGLVSARRNMRKLLSQSNQQQAGACRSFDRQEEQNLRRPPQDEKKRQLASLEKDLRALAKKEREFSEEIEPTSRSGQSADRATAPPSAGDPAARQQKAAEEAERLRDLARQDESLTDRTRRRLGHATETIRRSAERILGRHPEEAAEGARAAAEQLERLARQVGALKASELADQVARTRDLTRELAAEEARWLRLYRQVGPTGTTSPMAAGRSGSETWPRKRPAWAS